MKYLILILLIGCYSDSTPSISTEEYSVCDSGYKEQQDLGIDWEVIYFYNSQIYLY